MIDHYVSIGGEDVSADCYGIRITQTMTTDSDPGKATINLVNRQQKYTNHWPPQATTFTIYFANYSYKNEPKIFYGLAGHVTDIQCTAMEAVVTGECGMGHLADALGKEYYFSSDHPPGGVDSSATAISAAAVSGLGVATVPGGSLATALQAQAIQSNLESSAGAGECNTKDILIKILSDHKPTPIKVNYTATVLELSEQAYSAESNYQYVVNDIAQKVGAVFYFVDHDTLEFHSPEQWNGIYDLDGYMTNPEQTSSIMGYCNIVEVIGYKGYEEGYGPGSRMASCERIYAKATDEDSIAAYGELRAPAYYSLDITTQEAAAEKADELLAFFQLHKDALTKPVVAGMAPPLQARVGYTPFVPIDSSTVTPTRIFRHTTYNNLVRTEEEYNAMRASEQSLYEEVFSGGSGSWWGQVQGVVVEREIEYDADQGILCTLTLAPALVDVGQDGVIDYTDIEEDYLTSYSTSEETT